jgi:hypothetical protein
MYDVRDFYLKATYSDVRRAKIFFACGGLSSTFMLSEFFQ